MIYKGDVVVEFLNGMDIDVMVVGNYEFDDGLEVLVNFIVKVEFLILFGNIDVLGDVVLKGGVLGVLIVEKGGEKIGIVFVFVEDISEMFLLGKDVCFIEVEDYLKGVVEGFEVVGINKIVVVIYMGLLWDMKIVVVVLGIDVIVGGYFYMLLFNI